MKRKLVYSAEDRRSWIEPEHRAISVRRQCVLLGVSRASLYYEPVEQSQENLRLMQLIDRRYTRALLYGSRKMTAWLQAQGYLVNQYVPIRSNSIHDCRFLSPLFQHAIVRRDCPSSEPEKSDLLDTHA